jgi:hypothetical protein
MAKFPDLTNDGKVTQADILKGRGVYKKGGPVEGFKTKQQSMKGHYCWGDMPMKKAKGGTVRKSENPMRSESTEAAMAAIPYRQAGSDRYDADLKSAFARGYGAKRITQRDKDDADTRFGAANEVINEVSERTAHPFAGFRKELGDRDLADFRETYDSSLGKKRGGNVSKPKLASDKKKYSDRDMQGIISQAKQLAPKIIQANQARAAQAQAAAGAQQPPMGGAMPARPMTPARPPMGAMPTMKKGGKLKLRRKG